MLTVEVTLNAHPYPIDLDLIVRHYYPPLELFTS